jgi:aminoglycoside phosphotransferase family enzyme
VTGLTTQAVTTQLQAGQSLAQIAQLKGKTADDVIKAARAALSTQLQQAVTAGQITQAQADAQLADFDQKAPQIVNNTGGRGAGLTSVRAAPAAHAVRTRSSTPLPAQPG